MKPILNELLEISNNLPVSVVEDIYKRIEDWLASGGKEDDPYIEQQLRYAKHIIESRI